VLLIYELISSTLAPATCTEPRFYWQVNTVVYKIHEIQSIQKTSVSVKNTSLHSYFYNA
jgi:hypothetical protein